MKLLTTFLLGLSSVTAFAASPVALVYVPSANGINVYDASSAGKLTAIAGSPFDNTSGLFIGTNGKFVITLGTDYVHSYEVSSTGAIGKQVSEINTQSYSGSVCGTTDGAFLDHSGAYVYVLLNVSYVAGGGESVCNAIQTIQVSSTGTLSFKGSYTFPDGEEGFPVVAGNDKFALSITGAWHGDCCSITSFTRESTGLLEPGGSNDGLADGMLVPLPAPGWDVWQPVAMTEDPTNHYAVALQQATFYSVGTFGAVQIGSYTGSAEGASSSNTWENMPTVPGGVGAMRMSPSGKLLAISTATGIQLFHFNGANPITEFTGIIGTAGSVSQMQWDTHNHLYGLDSSGKLHVYNATTASVKEAAGSPYVVPEGAQANGLIVRSIP